MSFPVLRVIARLFAAPIALFGLYVQFHGDYGPGGGFQAGVILASSVILYALVFGIDAAKAAVPPGWLRVGAALGALLFIGTGFSTVLLGAPFLDYDAFGAAHNHGQHVGIVVVELGVGLAVTCVILGIYYFFAGRAPEPDSGGESGS